MTIIRDNEGWPREIRYGASDETREAYDERQMDGLVATEEEWRARAEWCAYRRPTGDKKYPVLCDKDGKYARAGYCDTCKAKR